MAILNTDLMLGGEIKVVRMFTHCFQKAWESARITQFDQLGEV